MMIVNRRIAGGLAALALALLPACDGARGGADLAAATTRPVEAAPGEHRHHAAPAPAPGEPTGLSLYNLASGWKDQHGEVRELGSLGGRVQVVAMVYTHCSRTCPWILRDMKRIEAELEASHPGEVGFVLVSIDPERDTPDRLLHFAGSTRLDPGRWTLLSGSDGDVLELAALLGVKYRRENPTDFSHSNVLTVLDRAGEIAHQQIGLGEGVEETIREVKEALTRPAA